MYWHQVEMFVSHGYSLTSPYRHLYNTDTSLSRTVRIRLVSNAKSQTFPTSIIRTPL